MPKKKPITPFGWAIIRRLAELKMSRREFCQMEDIPESRLSEIIYDTRQNHKYRTLIAKQLGISESQQLDRKAE